MTKRRWLSIQISSKPIASWIWILGLPYIGFFSIHDYGSFIYKGGLGASYVGGF
jgi:hypothetical protein